LIHDRDALYTDNFDSILKASGVTPVKLPTRSPNLNAHAERFVRSIKEECLDHLILSSEDQLRYVMSEYLNYCHHQRIHQGLNKIIEPKHEGCDAFDGDHFTHMRYQLASALKFLYPHVAARTE